MRASRIVTLLALGASVALPQTQARAVDSVAYVFPLLCNDEDGVRSDDLLPVDLAGGTYAVAVAGACTVVGGQLMSTDTTTPCTAPFVGSIPCAELTVHNVPYGVCATSTGGLVTDCGSDLLLGIDSVDCGYYSVLVASQCVTGQVGVVQHAGGPMTVEFVDSPGLYFDNAGVLLVTVVRIPL